MDELIDNLIADLPDEAPEEQVTDLLPEVLVMTTEQVPTHLGCLVGAMFRKLASYGARCGWDTEKADGKLFLQNFHEGFKEGSQSPVSDRNFSDRAAFIAELDGLDQSVIALWIGLQS